MEASHLLFARIYAKRSLTLAPQGVTHFGFLAFLCHFRRFDFFASIQSFGSEKQEKRGRRCALQLL